MLAEIDAKNNLLPHEAAKYLGISTQKLARLRRDGAIKGIKIDGVKLHVYSLEELRRVKPTIQPRDKPGPKPKKKNA